MADAESSARDRVHGRAVGATVVGDQPLGGDAIAGKVRDGAMKESDGGDRFLVGEDLDVGQAGGVVDRDVDVLPADELATDAFGVGAGASGFSLPGFAGEAVSRAVVDATEFS